MGGQGASSEIFAPDLLRGQVALVTGGGTGLGKATALELARCGASVTIAGRRGEVLEEAVAEIGVCLEKGEEDGAKVHGVTADIREAEDAARLIQGVLERHGQLDVLVNNAGGQYFAPAETIAAKGWNAVWRLNVGGMLNMSEAAFERAFRQAGSGTIVNVTLSPHHGMPGMAHSGAARATVEALTRELSRRWEDACVAVTAVAAGHFETEVLAKYPDSVRASTARSVPLQRMGTAQEHAWLVTLLASPLGRSFNGSTVTLDGARDNWAGPWPPPGLADESGEVPVEARSSREVADSQ
ncbi:MAG: short-chain dehydrogenase/reductase [Solirubrobacterales bacterium]|jgi:citronellol/citronellal dehydrogenase|nr:short-chain dehydrogenase/reductase [Solirubrobacterales bacterium]